MLSKNLLLELQEIFKEDYGIDLEYNEVERLGQFLVTYFEVLLKTEPQVPKSS